MNGWHFLLASRDVRVPEHGYDELAADGILVRDVVAGVHEGEVIEDCHMRRDILHILSAEVVGDHRLRIELDDHTHKTVDLSPLLEGPVFEPLHDPKYFARVVVEPVCGTVVWSNGADFAPEALYDLPSEDAERKAT